MHVPLTPAQRPRRFPAFLFHRRVHVPARPTPFSRQQSTPLLAGAGALSDYLLAGLYLLVLTSAVLTVLLLHSQLMLSFEKRLHDIAQAIGWSQVR